MAGLSRAPLFLLALALALALTASPAAGANANAGRPRLVGGLAEADVNEEGVQQALSFALSEYNKASNDAYHSRAMQVVRARKQVRPGAGGWGLGIEDRGRGPGFGPGARARGWGGGACAPGGVALVTRSAPPQVPYPGHCHPPVLLSPGGSLVLHVTM